MDATVIAFASGKGGTGKSTTAVFLGGALADGSLQKKKKGVLLIELDSGLRSIDIIAGVSGQTVFDIEDVLSGACEPEKAIVESPNYKGLYLISAPYTGGQIHRAALARLIETLGPSFDYILIDTAAGMGEAFEAALDVAHRMVLVLTPDPVALRDGKLLAQDIYKKTSRVRLVLNKVSEERLEREATLRDLDEAIDIVGVQLLGVVPDSPLISQCAAKGKLLPKTSLEARVYTAIAKRIRGSEVPLVFPKL